MSDNLTVFGTDYTGVTGIKAKGTGNGTLTYIRPSGTKSISANGTGIDVTEYASVDVAVPAQDSTFVVTVSYNDQTETWEPDCTWAEASAAYSAGKTFVAKGVWGTGVNTDCNVRLSNGSLIGIWFTIDANGFDDPTNTDTRVWYECYFDSNGFIVTDTVTFPLPTWSKTITTNGTHDVTYYASVDVAVPGVTPTGNINITQSGVTDVTNYATATVPEADFGPSVGGSFIYSGDNLVWRESGGGYAESAGWVNEGGVEDYLDYNAIPQNTTITPTTSAQTIGGARYMMQGPVTVAAMPSGTAGTPSATKGSVSNHSVSVTPSVTNQTGYITGGTKTGTAVTVSASELVSGSETKTANGTYDVTNLAQLVVDVQGGESSSMLVDVVEVTSGTSSSISFSGLKGEPVIFDVIIDEALSPSAQATVAALSFDGTTIHGQTITNTSNAQVSYEGASFTKSYSNGTLTITSNGPAFASIPYFLTYAYGGSTSDTDTKDVQVGSGATSITFSGLEDEPIYWSCIFKSNFSTSSGYQRVIFVNNDGNHLVGIAMDSSAHPTTAYWTASYSNGSLTITSQGTNAGGYFHQPGYYQLTYAIDGQAEPEEIDVQPLSVTQNGTYTAPSGTAYSPVTVNVSGSGSVHVGKTTWNNSSTSTVSHQFTGLSGTPKAAFLRCTSQLTRSSSNTYYYIADIFWDGTDAYGNYHLRSNGSFNNVASDAQSGFNVSVSGTSITFSSDATSRSSAPGSFYNGTYELVYIY